jgi:lipoprotein-anchoring transpeptidase ErfK/SrfK
LGRAVLAVAAVVIFVAVALSLHQRTQSKVVGHVRSASSVAPSTTIAKLPAGASLIATAKVGEVAVFDRPGSTTPIRQFGSPWFIGGNTNAPVPLVFRVQQERADGWLQVSLPIRPNGSTAWVYKDDVNLTETTYQVAVELGSHRLQVRDGDKVVLEDTVAAGSPQTPTPTGDFYIVALLKAPNPGTVYGPYAFGLSGHSEVLDQFAGGDAELGIHGNNDASVLGQDVSHGCIRMSNEGITTLAGILPLGTPVAIRP